MNLSPARLALIAAAGCFAVSVAAAQNLPPPSAALAQPPFALPPFKNLKVFPKDISRAELLGNMKFFAQSLGVRCTYCHVGEEGKPLATYDFASDAKDHKTIARDMIRMADHINQDHLPKILVDPEAKVSCFTCHRGSTKPATQIPPGAILVPPPPGATPPHSS
jgi:photosynthetic reaction center cytochrome c subunit